MNNDTNTTNSNPTEIHHVIILDKSGSMEDVKGVTINGYNENIQTIRKDQEKFPDQTNLVTLITFNNEITEDLLCRPVEETVELNNENYNPDSGTALNDAICHAIKKVQEKLVGKTNFKVLVTILTDGAENASKIYSRQDAANQIKDLTAKGWTFAFLGCSQDTMSVANNYNISASNTLQFGNGTAGTAKAFTTMSAARSAYSMNVASNVTQDSLTQNFFSTVEEPEIKYDASGITNTTGTNTTTNTKN